MGRSLAAILAGAAGVWVVLLVAAPLLPTPEAAVTYVIGSLICHQRPERSFHVAGAQLPVCGRCLGIYAGAALGSLIALRRMSVFRPAPVLMAAATPTLVTLAVEWAGLWNPGNVVRALTGLVLGATVAAVVVTLNYDECTPRRPIASNRPRTLI